MQDSGFVVAAAEGIRKFQLNIQIITQRLLMIKTINDAEIDKLVSAALKQSPRDFTMISLALFTGLRVCELVGLYIEDVAPFGDVSTILTVPQRIGKNSKKREIPMNHDTINLIKSFFLFKIDNTEPTTPSSSLFVSRNAHRPLSTRDFQRIV
ncbi:unnamed protein product, partial [marine sediment metagenome]